MCGVWVALEDIYPTAGPLAYVPGSQRLPYLQARDVGYQQIEGVVPSQEIFHAAWDQMLDAHGMKPESFSPKQGEALIWAANLIHGGSAVRDLSITRWSQVTHYFFEGCLHYTPMLSNWPVGPIAWRSPFDVASHAPHSEALRRPKQINHAAAAQLFSSFDPSCYLQANPDVAAAGANAYEHLIRHGLNEERPWQ